MLVDPIPFYCPLCASARAKFFHKDKKRVFYRCDECFLVFVPAKYHLSEAAEKSQYDLHQNDIADTGYRRFLSRLSEPLISLLEERHCNLNKLKGLDFGCGPAAALADLLSQQGIECDLYDKFYCDDRNVLANEAVYDLITMTEVIEHLSAPLEQFELCLSLLKSGGIFALMTKLVIDKEAFAQWHYKNDPTHICFFSRETLSYLALRYDLSLQYFAADSFAFTKAV